MMKHFENYLNNYDFQKEGTVRDAVIYSIVDGGKRIRPQLLLSLLKDYGVDIEKGYASALAIEMIHSYSLVHDDLPSMDDDDYRRSKLSTHKQFGEDVAILAGDALLTEAFASISNDQTIDSDKKVKLISLLAQYSGMAGMIYGQELDLAGEDKTLTVKEIQEINHYKTANLITFSLLAAAVIAGHQDDFETLKECASNLGLAFQIQDDIFDVTKSYEELGKMPSDEDNNKSTYVKVLGLEESKEVLDQLFEKCKMLLNKLDLQSNNLYNLIIEIELRIN